VNRLQWLFDLPGASVAELLLALQHYFSLDYFDAFRLLLEEREIVYGLQESSS
jgi:hypothetical protein